MIYVLNEKKVEEHLVTREKLLWNIKQMFERSASLFIVINCCDFYQQYVWITVELQGSQKISLSFARNSSHELFSAIISNDGKFFSLSSALSYKNTCKASTKSFKAAFSSPVLLVIVVGTWDDVTKTFWYWRSYKTSPQQMNPRQKGRKWVVVL